MDQVKFTEGRPAAPKSEIPPTTSSSVGVKVSEVLESSRRQLTLDARPCSILFDPEQTAIIVVDMQNDFGTKGGMFDQAGIDISVIQRAIAPTVRVLAAARKVSMKIIYLKMAFEPDLSDLGAVGSPNWRVHKELMSVGTTVLAPNGSDSRILIRDTWNTDIVSELQPDPSDKIIYKSRFSGFYRTDLDDELRQMGIRYIVFTGCTTSVCVESTIRDAMFRDYTPILLADCAGETVGNDFPRSNHEASLLVIQSLFGWVSTSKEFIQSLNSAAAPA